MSFNRLPMAGFAAALLIILIPLLSSTACAENPNLYLDGDALAKRMAGWVLQNTEPMERVRRIRAFNIGVILGNGVSFSGKGAQGRLTLEDWILDQPDGSIYPHSLIQRAIAIEGGNVEKGLMLCWDVLREDWPHGDQRNYLPRTFKLASITGERDEFNGNTDPGGGRETVTGDEFSAWYHFLGTAIYAYHYEFSKNPLAIPPAIALWRARSIDSIENPLKRWIMDREGAIFGRQLATALKNHRESEATPRTPASGPEDYLYNNPAKFDRYRKNKEKISAKRPPPTGLTQMQAAWQLRKRIRESPATASELASLAVQHKEYRPFLLHELWERDTEDSRQALRKMIQDEGIPYDARDDVLRFSTRKNLDFLIEMAAIGGKREFRVSAIRALRGLRVSQPALDVLESALNAKFSESGYNPDFWEEGVDLRDEVRRALPYLRGPWPEGLPAKLAKLQKNSCWLLRWLASRPTPERF